MNESKWGLSCMIALLALAVGPVASFGGEAPVADDARGGQLSFLLKQLDDPAVSDPDKRLIVARLATWSDSKELEANRVPEKLMAIVRAPETSYLLRREAIMSMMTLVANPRINLPHAKRDLADMIMGDKDDIRIKTFLMQRFNDLVTPDDPSYGNFIRYFLDLIKSTQTSAEMRRLSLENVSKQRLDKATVTKITDDILTQIGRHGHQFDVSIITALLNFARNNAYGDKKAITRIAPMMNDKAFGPRTKTDVIDACKEMYMNWKNSSSVKYKDSLSFSDPFAQELEKCLNDPENMSGVARAAAKALVLFLPSKDAFGILASSYSRAEKTQVKESLLEAINDVFSVTSDFRGDSKSREGYVKMVGMLCQELTGEAKNKARIIETIGWIRRGVINEQTLKAESHLIFKTLIQLLGDIVTDEKSAESGKGLENTILITLDSISGMSKNTEGWINWWTEAGKDDSTLVRELRKQK